MFKIPLFIASTIILSSVRAAELKRGELCKEASCDCLPKQKLASARCKNGESCFESPSGGICAVLLGSGENCKDGQTCVCPSSQAYYLPSEFRICEGAGKCVKTQDPYSMGKSQIDACQPILEKKGVCLALIGCECKLAKPTTIAAGGVCGDWEPLVETEPGSICYNSWNWENCMCPSPDYDISSALFLSFKASSHFFLIKEGQLCPRTTTEWDELDLIRLVPGYQATKGNLRCHALLNIDKADRRGITTCKEGQICGTDVLGGICVDPPTQDRNDVVGIDRSLGLFGVSTKKLGRGKFQSVTCSQGQDLATLDGLVYCRGSEQKLDIYPDWTCINSYAGCSCGGYAPGKNRVDCHAGQICKESKPKKQGKDFSYSCVTEYKFVECPGPFSCKCGGQSDDRVGEFCEMDAVFRSYYKRKNVPQGAKVLTAKLMLELSIKNIKDYIEKTSGAWVVRRRGLVEGPVLATTKLIRV